MKKLIITAAVLACAASVVAQTVTSANIVGYSKKALAGGGFEIVSPQFLADATGGIALADAFSGLNDQSVVFIWTGAGYTDVTYFDGFGWFDASFVNQDNLLLAQGDALWLKGGGATSVNAIMSGEVPSVGSITNALAAGFNLIANPYPVAITLADIPAAVLSDQDVVFLWSGSGYTDYTYFAGFGWFDAAFTPSDTVPVAVGQGFWLKTAVSGSLVFNKNF